MTPPLGIYLHVPFCATLCTYCDFPKVVGGDQAGWAATAIAELRLARAAMGDAARPAATVFFGGGTPTLLPAGDLGAVLQAVRDELGLEPGAEVTVEANPDSADERTFAALLGHGVTRVSIGMQSGAPHVLRFLGRTHAAERPAQAAREAFAAGFEHVGLDLIYGSPVETTGDWRRTVEAAIAAGPDHVSAYALTIEPGTPPHARVRRGTIPPPDEDAMAERYMLADDLLPAAGLRWYEVSNWARDADARCRHNAGYGHGGEWWGIGPGAHSAVGGRRWWNVRRPVTWAVRVAAGRLPQGGAEALDEGQRRLERLMVAVRTREGLATGDRRDVADLAADGLLDLAGDRAVLTLRGRLLADHVTRRLAG